MLAALVGACSWDKLFEREDPAVEQARHALEASAADGDADLVAARIALEELLRFRCESEGGVDLVVKLPGASVDLGLLVFRVAELVGQRFGDEELPLGDGGEGQEQVAAARARELDCAHRLLMRLAGDPATPRAIALRARYLLGNFAFLSKRYKDAIARYDEVLLAHPARGVDPLTGEVGPPLDDDAVARDAAWNRAIALERLENEKKDAGEDTGSDGDSDAGADSDAQPEADTAPESDAQPDADSGHDASDADSGADVADSARDGGSDARDAGGHGDGGGEPDKPDTGGPKDGGDAATPPPTSPSSKPSGSPAGADLSELDRFDRKAPLDPDQAMKKKVLVPKGLDK